MQTKRELLVSKGWIQAVALVGLCGFLLLGILAHRTYTDEPPIRPGHSARIASFSSRERTCWPARKSF